VTPADLLALAQPLAGVTDFTREAQDMLRDTDRFSWITVFALTMVMYVYATEIERRNWSAVLAGLALFGMDWINEVANALVLEATGRAAVWTTTAHTSFQIFVGLNIEISFMFAIAGIVFVKFLPPDPATKILRLPNRVFYVAAFSIFSVFVEVLLWAGDVFHWEYWWWNFPNVPLIVLLGYATFYAMAAWVYDMDSRRKQVTVVSTLLAVDVLLIVTFGVILGWI
jgi:hypothetical protein